MNTHTEGYGTEFADRVEQGIASGVQGAVNWWQDASADQEGVFDDILRATAGGIKNVGNWWAESSADQEGIGDDILRGIGSVAGTGMRVLDAGSYYGGKLGGGFATMVGVDSRIGGALGNVGGDLLAGGLFAKGLKTAKMTKQLRNLRAAGAWDWELDAITKGKYAMAFGDDIPTPGVLDDALTAVMAKKGAGKKLSKLELALYAESNPTPFRVLDDGRKIYDASAEGGDVLKHEIRTWLTKHKKSLLNKSIKRDDFGQVIWKGKVRRIDGLHRYLDGTGDINLVDVAHQQQRLQAMRPWEDPRVIKAFKEADKSPYVDSDIINLENYQKYITSYANDMDNITSDMARHWGWNKAKHNTISEWVNTSHALDKEHAHALFGGGSNDWLSQFFGSRQVNRSSGALDQFTDDVMEILGAPHAKTSRSTHPRAQWSANEESAVNWIASESARLSKGQRRYWNPAQELTSADWLEIQQAFARIPAGATKPMQSEVAEKVLRQREIIYKWRENFMPRDGESIAMLARLLENSWKMDSHRAKLLLERTIADASAQKILKEIYKFDEVGNILLDKAGEPIMKKAPRWVKKAENLAKDSNPVWPKRQVIPPAPKDQQFEYIETVLDLLDEQNPL